MIIPYTFVNNTTIDPAQVNANFVAVNNALQSQDTVIENFRTQIQTQLNTSMNQIRALLPVGMMMLWSTATPPNGYIPVIGQDISSYTSLTSLLGITTLPDSRGKSVWFAAEALTTLGATLPNITGTFKALTHHAYDQDRALSGAFSFNRRTSGHNIGDGGTWSDMDVLNFNAHNSNSIYTDNATVRPPSITSLLVIKYE